MQIVSGPDDATRVHYEAPPSTRVPQEMERFLDWFAQSGSLSPVTCAGVAHLWFECIQAFEDGNGRIGRAVAEKALSQGRQAPVFSGLATALLRRRKAYYAALEAASITLDATAWLLWFAHAVADAQAQTRRLIGFLIAKTRFFDHYRGQMDRRQEKAMLRLFRAGPEGFEGGLSADNYRTIAGASPATAARDLADLVAKGAISLSGERRGTRYRLPERWDGPEFG